MDINQAGAIARTYKFQKRVDALMVKASIAILNGAPDSADLILGQRILDGGEPIERWCLGVVVQPSIIAGAHTDDGDTIDDATLETTVNSLWAAFKK